MTKNIGVIVGSLRKGSWNRQLAKALVGLSPAFLNLHLIEIGDLPLYNPDPDDDGHPYPAWVTFRNQVKKMDGVLFVTPEYNRSVPSALKNAIDVGSRPYGLSIWNKKASAVISSSTGAIGGFGANHHLRQLFVFLNMPCMQQPEAYLSGIDKLFNEQGEIINKNTSTFLQNFMQNYASWVEKITV